MQDKLNQWLGQVDGKQIEAEDSSNYAQCFDLAFNWCDFLDIPRDSIRHLYAYQIFTNPNPDTTQYWDMINNTPTGVPQAGDLVIWGTQVGTAGHVAIFKEGDTSSFRSEDQNWAGIQKAMPVNHSYNGVLGWLHPKKVSEPMVVITQKELDQMRTDRDTNFNNWQAEIVKYNDSQTSLNASVSQLEGSKAALTTCQAQVTQITQKLNNCENKPPQVVEKPVEKIVYINKVITSADIARLGFWDRVKLLWMKT